MTIYTEQDIVNHYIDNTHFDENIKIPNNNLEVFFKGDNKDVPIEYYYIFRELALVRNLYKNSIRWCSRYYYCYIVAVFTCIMKDNIKIPQRFLTYIRNNKYQFTTIYELMDYFVTTFLPYRDDLIAINELPSFAIARFYQRVGHNVIFTHKGNFQNNNEKEIYDIIDEYEYHGIYAIRTLLIGFYYKNHNKYNLNINMLKRCLNDYEYIASKMILNGLDYNYFTDELILELFQNNKNKMIIK